MITYFCRVAFLVNGTPSFRVVSEDTPIKTVIQELLETSRMKGEAEDYALIYQIDGKGVKQYRVVTEKDRAEMNGKIIELGESPSKSSRRIIEQLQKKTPDQKDLTKALKDLTNMAVDATFAKAFSSNGLNIILSEVAGGKFREAELGIVLEGVNLLVEHMVESDTLKDAMTIQQDFIKQLADLTIRDGEQSHNVALWSALNLLAILVKEREDCRSIIDMFVALPNLISLLESQDKRIKLSSISLINALLKHASEERRGDMVMALQERTARNIILEHLLGMVSTINSQNKDSSKTKDSVRGSGDNFDKEGTWADDMSHQLYLLQHHTLSQVETRLYTKIEPQDSEALNKIKDLRSTAFDTGSPTIKNNTRYAQDHKKLGFDNHKDPSLDFLVTPPGILALDCMDHFAKTQQEQFMKVVLENSCRSDNHECPFAKSSIELVRQLADLLGVGRVEDPNCKQYHEMFFKAEHPFEEFFCHCVIQLNKTWRDMRATKEDFNKVFDVVVEQIEGSLNPENAKERPKTFEQFRQNVRSYLDISRKWQADARSRKAWDESAPVAELRKHMEPETKELIRQQRGNFMVEGTRFQKYKKSGEENKGQFRYVKLHPNHKTIYVGDWNSEKSVPTIEDLEPWLQISDIELFTKGDCPFIKNMKKEMEKMIAPRAFSLQLQGGENTSLDLIAPDQQTYNYWEDGIKCLKQMEMSSKDFDNEKKTLLDMEVKLRLLDLEGVDLPATAPMVPPPPPDFNFSSC